MNLLDTIVNKNEYTLKANNFDKVKILPKSVEAYGKIVFKHLKTLILSFFRHTKNVHSARKRSLL